MINKCGEKQTVLLYLLYHFVCCFLTILVSIICYHSYIIHTVMMIGLSSTCFWNGATYYMDHFSKKYEVNLAKLDEMQKKVSEELGETKKTQ